MLRLSNNNIAMLVEGMIRVIEINMERVLLRFTLKRFHLDCFGLGLEIPMTARANIAVQDTSAHVE